MLAIILLKFLIFVCVTDDMFEYCAQLLFSHKPAEFLGIILHSTVIFRNARVT